MPESLKGCRSAGVKLSGSANQRFCLGKFSVSGLSISITVARETSSTARAEYSTFDVANKRKRPRFTQLLTPLLTPLAGGEKASPAPAPRNASEARLIACRLVIAAPASEVASDLFFFAMRNHPRPRLY